MKYAVSQTQKVMSFEYDHWKYNVLEEVPPFNKKAHAQAYADTKNREENRVEGDPFNWYYSVIEKG